MCDIVFVYPQRVLMGFLPVLSFVIWPYITGVFERSVEEVDVEVGCRAGAVGIESDVDIMIKCCIIFIRMLVSSNT